MIAWLDVVLVLIFLSILLALASNRLLELIKISSFQGFLVPLVSLPADHPHTGSGSFWFTGLLIGIKGVLIPLLLWVAIRKTAIRREVEPIVGYNLSLLAGLGMILASLFLSRGLPAAGPMETHLLLPCAITTMASGLFLLMTRRKAITQVIGYLMLENGIYLAGAALTGQTHTLFVLEFGILLDLLVGVMVMGIIVHRINHTYNDLDLSFLSELKE